MEERLDYLRQRQRERERERERNKYMIIEYDLNTIDYIINYNY